MGVALIVDRAFPSTEWGNWVGLAVAFGVVVYWMRREDAELERAHERKRSEEETARPRDRLDEREGKGKGKN